MIHRITRLVLAILLLLALPVLAEEGAGDARRHMVRGLAAIEMAKSSADLKLAAKEFRRAAELDAGLAVAWYNLGAVQSKLGEYESAIQSYRRYLELSPKAEDAQKVSDEIIKLEFRQEQVAQVAARVGTWVDEEGSVFSLAMNGDQMTLKTAQRRVTEDEVVVRNPIVGQLANWYFVPLTYQMKIEGDKLKGVWSRPGFKLDACDIPEESGEVTGEVLDSDGKITLQYSRTKFSGTVQPLLMSDDTCNVVSAGKSDFRVSFFGPLPSGGIGVALGGIQVYRPEGFSAAELGWHGHVFVAEIVPDSPAHRAGLRKGDQILSIDGVPVKGMKAYEPFVRLRGKPDTDVTLTVLHKETRETGSVTIRRFAVAGKK